MGVAVKVDVYGGYHSPWVQAVLLALHDKGIEHSVRQVPPLQSLKQWGVLMPAVSIDGGPWQVESSHILVKLGFEQISDHDLQAVTGAWQGVVHRADNPLRFFAAFARAGDRSPSLLKRCYRNFLRSFIPLYMFVLLNLAKRIRKLKAPKNFADQYLFWEQALASSDGPFLDGAAPGARDFLLFGVIQCHSSIPVPALIPLQHDERLSGIRGWIAGMHERLHGYAYLYSGGRFEPRKPEPVTADPLQLGVFYLGLTTMFAMFPVTLPLVFLLMRKIKR